MAAVIVPVFPKLVVSCPHFNQGMAQVGMVAIQLIDIAQIAPDRLGNLKFQVF